MTGIESLALLKMLAADHEKTGGPRLPFDDIARVIQKLDAILASRGLVLSEEENLTEAERAWLLGETVDAVMLHAEDKTLDPVSAMNDLKSLHGAVPLVAVLERRVDALLKAEGIDWGGNN